MTRTLRLLTALATVLFVLTDFSACGGGGIPRDAVVRVGGKSITKSGFEHWLSIAVASTAGTAGFKPAVPHPPNYTACIAHVQAIAPKPAKGQSKPTMAQLKSECEQQYKSLQQEVLGFLINSAWVLDEAESLGLKVSDAELKREFGKIQKAQFPRAGQFQKFLASTGYTTSDLLLRVKVNLLSSKIQQKIAKQKHSPGRLTAQQQQQALSKWSNEFHSRWEAKTECASGFVVRGCRGYRDPRVTSSGEG